jgi:hypothetical protein
MLPERCSNAAQTLRNRFVSDAKALRKCCSNAAQTLSNDAILIRNRYVIASQRLLARYKIVMQALLDRFSNTAQLLGIRCAIVLQMLLNRCAIPSKYSAIAEHALLKCCAITA